MAVITRTCGSRGASVTFTINDATLRTTNVQTITTARQMVVRLFDSQGRLDREITPTPSTTENVSVDVPARLVEIVKADTTIKSYVCPAFAVFF